MNYKYMDSKLIEINMIEEVYSISSLDLLDSSNSNGKLIGFNANVKLSDGNILNLTYFSNDNLYIFFVNKLIDYYNRHKSEFIDSEKIVLDLNTRHKTIDKRSILLFSMIEDNLLTEKTVSLFKDKPKKDYSMFGYSSIIDSLLNTVISELYKIFQYLNEDFEIINDINTYNNNFIIKIKRNNKYDIIPVIFEIIDDNNYRFTLGNIFKPGYVIMDISYKDNKTLISWDCSNKVLTSFTEYLFNDGIKKRESLYSNDETLFFQEEYLEQTNIKDEFKSYFEYVNEDFNLYKFYKINEYEYYALYENIETHESNKELQSRKIKFSIRSNNIYITDSYVEKIYTDSIVVYTNASRMDSTIINGEQTIIETSFLDSVYSSSQYKNYLQGKVITTILPKEKEVVLKHIKEEK